MTEMWFKLGIIICKVYLSILTSHKHVSKDDWKKDFFMHNFIIF